MKTVRFYIRGIRYSVGEGLEGQYISLMEYKDVRKDIYGTVNTGNITSNRMIIRGLIKAIKVLKEPCKIELYTHTQIGLKYMKNKKGKEIEGVRNCVNKDLLLELKEELIKGKHEIEEIIGKRRQGQLARMLEEYRDEENERMS